MVIRAILFLAYGDSWGIKIFGTWNCKLYNYHFNQFAILAQTAIVVLDMALLFGLLLCLDQDRTF